MPAYAYAILVAGWLLWLMPFSLAKRNTGPAEKLDRRARWGILLVVIAYSMLWQNQFCARLPTWRAVISIVLFLLAALLSWLARARSAASGASMPGSTRITK